MREIIADFVPSKKITPGKEKKRKDLWWGFSYIIKTSFYHSPNNINNLSIM